jgi:hypothetical protein
MIVKEYFMTRNDGVRLYRTYSDEEKPLLQVETGIAYAEAIDVEDAPYTYTEFREISETITPGKPFNKGDLGYWKSEIYECLLDNIIWNPDQFAAAWTKVPV